MGEFQIKARAVLLTYNLPEGVEPDLQTFWDALGDKVHDDDRVSLTIEKGEHRHYHAFVERVDSQIDCGIGHFQLYGCIPNAQPNTVKGSGFRTAADRGHFYCFCDFKNTWLASTTSWSPNDDYAPHKKWILDLWKKGKIDDNIVVECLAEYKCLDPRDKAMIECTISVNDRKRKADAAIARAERIRSKFDPFPVLPEVENWYSQYEDELSRYNFLIIHGPSKTRKTEFVRDRFKNTFVHTDVVSWNGYNDEEHQHILFDDVKNIYKYISDNRHLFQAAGTAMVQTSATNVYARAIDVTQKAIIITTNEAPTSEWILANAVVIHVMTPLGRG